MEIRQDDLRITATGGGTTNGPIDLRLHTTAASVSVEESDGDQLEVSITGESGDPKMVWAIRNATLHQNGDTWTLTIPHDGTPRDRYDSYREDILAVVRMPAGGTIRADVTAGSLRTRVQVDNIISNTTGGSVDLDIARTATVNATGGGVHIGRADWAQVQARGGGVSLDEVGEVRVQSTGGSVRIDQLLRSAELNATGGSIRVHSDAFPGPRLTANALGGSVKVSGTVDYTAPKSWW